MFSKQPHYGLNPKEHEVSSLTRGIFVLPTNNALGKQLTEALQNAQLPNGVVVCLLHVLKVMHCGE